MSVALREKIAGCILGGAVGDAMGSPVSGFSSIELERKHGRVTDLCLGAGKVTETTLMTLALVRVYQYKRRHLDAYDWDGQMLEELSRKAWIPWLDRDEVIVDVLRYPEKYPYMRLLNKTDPRNAGVGNTLDYGACVYVAPIGLVNPGNPSAAYREAEAFLSAHTAGYALEAGCVMAAVVAEACRADATVGSITDVALRLAKGGTSLCLKSVLHASERCNSPMGIEDYRKLLLSMADYMPWDIASPADGKPKPSELPNGQQAHRGYAIEELMAALAIFNVEGGDFEQAVSSAVGFGRGCGPIASIVGSVCGTLMGASAIPEATASKLLASNDRLELTNEVDVFTAVLFNMVKRDRDRTSAWIETLDALYPLE